MKPIEIIACGGTIEKQYKPSDGSMGFDEQTQALQWLAQGRVHPDLPITVRTLMLIDSLDATDQHRALIAEAVAQSPATQVLLLHGTDTMGHTAATVEARRRAEQVVVITGAMIPAQIPNSDAIFNVGYALAACQLLSPGTHIAMGGRVGIHNKVFKNKALGRFDHHGD